MDLSVFIGAISILTTIGGGILGWYVKSVEKKSDQNSEEIDKLRDQTARDTQEIREELYKHRVHSAEHFSTKEDIKAMENNIVNHLRRVEDKLDRKQDKTGGHSS